MTVVYFRLSPSYVGLKEQIRVGFATSFIVSGFCFLENKFYWNVVKMTIPSRSNREPGRKDKTTIN